MFQNLSPRPFRAALVAAAILLTGNGLCGDEGSQLTVKRIFSQPNLSGRPTQGVQWRPDSKSLSYLETSGEGKTARTELWTIDAATGERKLLVPGDKMAAMLPAAKAKDTQATGLGRRPPAQYRWAPGGEAILFVGANALAWYDLKKQASRILTQGKEGVADAKNSPDGKYVSFVRDHNVFVVNISDGKERAITQAGTEEVRKGELDWVYPEELDCKTAYWWSPDSSKIAFLEMDERKVNKYPLVDFESPHGATDEERYPVPGGSNPVVHVYVANVSGGKPRLMDTGAETDQYIPRVDWLPDSRRLAIQRLNRPQMQLELLIADEANGKSSVLLTEKDAYWINISDDLHFLKDGKRFLWSSERTGYRHLYLYGMDGKEIKQLTSGEWETDGIESVDEGKGAVYFKAAEKTPIERHLYRVNLDGSGFERITKKDGVHATMFAPDASGYLDTFSDAKTPPQQWLSKIDGSGTIVLNENKVVELEKYHFSPMEFFKLRSHDGVDFNAWIIKPPDFDPAKKYPVLVFTYGGPHAQVVMNQWGGANYLWHQSMAQKGFVIFAMDNRGSAGRGHRWEEPIHLRFGAQELSDQRDGAAWLKGQPWVDASRIGIWGWSYGGHMTLHAMFEAGDDFKAGFAGGPVTDWHYYDTIYTERYIGLLPKNEENYQESSPIEKAQQLRGRLLIAHGTGDDNVHFANTLAVVDKLIEHGKSVEVMPFPGRGHGVSDPPARILLMERVTRFFEENLK